MSGHLLALFIASGLLLNLTPGPDVLCIVNSALRQGTRAGVWAALGVTSGCFVHIFAAALGVGALLAASAWAFTVLKYLGASYLIYIGARMLLARASAIDLGANNPYLARLETPKDLFLRGFWTNALNPKVALFFLAFVPQFIEPGVQHKALAFLGLGLLFNFNGLWVNIGWAAAAAWMARRSQTVRRSLHRLERGAGALFIGFGLKLALSSHPTP